MGIYVIMKRLVQAEIKKKTNLELCEVGLLSTVSSLMSWAY